MNSQDILRFGGSKLDLRLDTSEFYDYEIAKTELDFDSALLNLSTEIQHSELELSSECITGTTLDAIKPWIIEIDKVYSGYSCNSLIRRRTEKGWTLDFVFNREDIEWSGGTTFYYWGILNETDPNNYLDNNLSFSFTDDGRIKWEAYHYSGYCDSTSGYTETNYIASGQTGVLCNGGTSEDFNVTITFNRYNKYENCQLYNEGGKNDYITGYTVTNTLDVLTGATEDYTLIERLNSTWSNERAKRLGTLKIYLNGHRIYNLENWEEIIPSERLSGGTIAQVWGGGTTGISDLHTGTTQFNLKRVKYFEKPLDFPYVKHHYLVSTKPFFNINECPTVCVDSVILYSDKSFLHEDGDYIFTEDSQLLNF